MSENLHFVERGRRTTEKSQGFLKHRALDLANLLENFQISVAGGVSSLLGSVGSAMVVGNEVLRAAPTSDVMKFLGMGTIGEALTKLGINIAQLTPPLAIASGILTLSGAAVGWQGAKQGSAFERMTYIGTKALETVAWVAAPLLGLPITVPLVASGLGLLHNIWSNRHTPGVISRTLS
ncbi:MAG: hypothetical protein WC775_05495 [Patescibacteria group bacterium]|jgi:hypothetical protein